MNQSCDTRRNPSSNRCVLMNGKIGKHLIGRPRRCDTVINTKTSRCVLRKKKNTKHKTPEKRNENKTKKTKKITKHKTPKKTKKKTKKKTTKDKKTKSVHKITTICVPRKFEDLAHRCACKKKWLMDKKLGSGAYGKVYKACRSGNTEYAVKIQKYDKFAKAEVQAYLSLTGTKLTPKLHAAWICKGKMYLVLDKVVECSKIPLTQVEKLLKKLEQFGWLHVDVHPGNVMCTNKGKHVLIDFGWAVKKREFPYPNHPRKTYADLKKNQSDNVNYFFKD